MCFDRCSQELLCESGDQDERVADVGVSGEQLPLPLYCESRQDVKHTAWYRNKSIHTEMFNSLTANSTYSIHKAGQKLFFALRYLELSKSNVNGKLLFA